MKIIILGAIATALTLLAMSAFGQVTIRDDLGRTILVQKKATRIVTLAPFLTELAYAAGAGELLVGVGANSYYPPDAAKLPAVSAAKGSIVAQLSKLKPDLVLAWRDGITREDVEQISAFGAVVFVAQGRRLEDVPRLLKVIGVLTASDVTPVVEEYESKLLAIRKANAGKPKLTAFLEIWHEPLTTIAGEHFLSEALDYCRAENVFKDLSGIAPKVSWDEVVKRNPYVIIGSGSAANIEEFVKNWGLRANVPAAREQRLLFLNAETLQRPSPRTPSGIETLCRGLEPFRAGMMVAPPPPPPPPAPVPEPRKSQYGS